MKTRSLIGLGLCVALATMAPAAIADQDSKSGKKKGKAQQVQTDAQGHKITGTDQPSDEGSTSTVTFVDARGFMSPQAEPVQYRSDGSKSARLGLENLKYVVVTIDDNGLRTLSHRSYEDIQKGFAPTKTETEEK